MAVRNTIVEERIKYLSDLSETEYPFITLYLSINSHENLFEQAEKNRIFIKDSFRNSIDKIKEENNKDKLVCFQKDEEKILDYINNNLKTQAHGAAIFACSKLGIFETFQSLMSFENTFSVDSFPRLKQLAYQLEEYENTLVIIVDSKYSKILSLKIGGFVFREINITDIVHKFHKQGGWAQARYQRHINDQIHKHYEETAKVATELFDTEQYENVILIGQENEINNFKVDLPKRINMKVIGMDSLYTRENINKIMETIFDNLRKTEKERELHIVKDIITLAQSGGSETLGIQDTIQLAKEGRVKLLTAVKDYSIEGWRCDGCYYIDKNQYQAGCPICNGNMKHSDLIEEAIRLTLKNGGKVNLVEDEAAEEL
ncbi:MAG: Vms1/Ankzf1 family peptidyl-tRNA hydrolase, partial [Candidatus Gastranaerophilales bacterium]|nr:Vms1/Ankzf1 family peptidyl-tRNA hydrolase [Candidatus Gastranaerophilales bacterium]